MLIWGLRKRLRKPSRGKRRMCLWMMWRVISASPSFLFPEGMQRRTWSRGGWWQEPVIMPQIFCHCLPPSQGRQQSGTFISWSDRTPRAGYFRFKSTVEPKRAGARLYKEAGSSSRRTPQSSFARRSKQGTRGGSYPNRAAGLIYCQVKVTSKSDPPVLLSGQRHK